MYNIDSKCNKICHLFTYRNNNIRRRKILMTTFLLPEGESYGKTINQTVWVLLM